MSIKTGRAEGTARVTINKETCTACGLCVSVCAGIPLTMENKTVQVDQSRLFGCIGCGQCMAVCPTGSIEVRGRMISPEEMIPLPKKEKQASYEPLVSLMRARRSVRNFKDRPVERDVINKVIDAVSTAPMGIPPSDVELLIFEGREKVQEFGADVIAVMEQSRHFFGPVFRQLFRPFFGKEFIKSAKTFIAPMIKFMGKERKEGNDWLFYNAPTLIYFHVSPYADPADPLISATYAMLAAESLGLGACMIGIPANFIKYTNKLKKKYGIPAKNRQGIALILGYPAVAYKKSIKRTLGNVKFY
ncbi:MAG: 4Fe-4S dicluster domain-containing protein [bacterium]|nr:4Fe-4S dicluster domain-containing protein [bacterium]